jgi:hypothetical protein
MNRAYKSPDFQAECVIWCLFALQQRFQDAFLKRLDLNGAWAYMLVSTDLWLNLRMALVAAVVVLGVGQVAAALKGKVRVLSLVILQHAAA